MRGYRYKAWLALGYRRAGRRVLGGDSRGTGLQALRNAYCCSATTQVRYGSPDPMKPVDRCKG